jgi:hypothetical protein
MGLKFNPFSGNFDFTGGGDAAPFAGQVDAYADLPLDSTAALNSRWLVKNNSGTWPFSTYKQAGIYIRVNTLGDSRDVDYQFVGTLPSVMNDNEFIVYDDTDATKNLKFNVGANVPTASTVTLTAPSSSGTIALAEDISTVAITGDANLSAGRNKIVYLQANGGTSANVTLPFSSNQNGDTLTLISQFVGSSNVGSLTIRAAGQMSGGTPLGYTNLWTLTKDNQSLTVVSDGSNGFGGWTIVSLVSNFPTTDNAVQEYSISGVTLPNGDSGSGVQLTRNTLVPETPDGSDRTFNAEELIYRRVTGNAQRLDTYLKVKLEWQPVAPTSPTTAGQTGQIAYADPYFYICVGVDTWRRIPVAAW